MPGKLKRAWTKASTRWRRPEEQPWVCGPSTIVLPAGHLLPTYQRLHPRYDRFLPHLAAYLPAATTVIDVGANVGDTVAAMAASQPQAHYVCIEPDEVFHGFLLRNIERIKAAIPGVQIKAVRALVGKGVVSASLEGSGGTKHAAPGVGQRTETLDAIVGRLAVPPVSLLKSDVDGFDYDVLDSAAGLLVQQQPIVFFECQHADDRQRAGFERLFATLEQAGYTRWAVFDNFGEVMLNRTRPDQIVQLMNYVSRQNEKRTTRTIHYYDILAATPRHAERIDRALDAY